MRVSDKPPAALRPVVAAVGRGRGARHRFRLAREIGTIQEHSARGQAEPAPAGAATGRPRPAQPLATAIRFTQAISRNTSRTGRAGLLATEAPAGISDITPAWALTRARAPTFI